MLKYVIFLFIIIHKHALNYDTLKWPAEVRQREKHIVEMCRTSASLQNRRPSAVPHLAPSPQVTNQMIVSCMEYISDRGRYTIWNQPEEDVRSKIKDCISLRDHYHAGLQRAEVRGSWETPREKERKWTV